MTAERFFKFVSPRKRSFSRVPSRRRERALPAPSGLRPSHVGTRLFVLRLDLHVRHRRSSRHGVRRRPPRHAWPRSNAPGRARGRAVDPFGGASRLRRSFGSSVQGCTMMAFRAHLRTDVARPLPSQRREAAQMVRVPVRHHDGIERPARHLGDVLGDGHIEGSPGAWRPRWSRSRSGRDAGSGA